MSAQPPTGERKTYAKPALRCYGSIVATTQGSTGAKGDGGTKRLQ